MNRLVLALAATLTLGLVTPADAAFRIRIESGTTTGPGVVVTDNGAGDLNGASGAIVVSASVGQFTLTMTTGLSSQGFPGAFPGFYDAIDLNNVSINSSGAGTLRFILEQDGFAPAPDGGSSLNMQVGGVLTATVGSSVTFTSYADDSNAVPDLGPDVFPEGVLAGVTGLGGGTSVSTSVTFPAGAFAGTPSAPFTKTGTYSLYASVVVTFTGEGSVSFNQVTGTQPAPAGLLLVAAAVPCLAGGFLRRRKAATI